MNKDESILALLLRLRKLGIKDDMLLGAIESLPRELFLLPQHRAMAWKDISLPLPCGQMLWSVDVAARILHAAELKRGDTVLEIGCGSGYLSALSSYLCRKVRSVERYGKLVEQARLRFKHLQIENVVLQHGDGYGGANDGLYDCIICDSCYALEPEFLCSQLVSDGKVLVAVGEAGQEQMFVKLTMRGSRMQRQDLFGVRFTSIERGVAKVF